MIHFFDNSMYINYKLTSIVYEYIFYLKYFYIYIIYIKYYYYILLLYTLYMYKYIYIHIYSTHTYEYIQIILPLIATVALRELMHLGA